MAKYKYNCRKCPIRNRCIEESDNAPSVKSMIRHAFEARTDTLEVWGRLQRNCLLIKAEEERAKRASEESMLSRRLRQAREARKQASKSAAKEPAQSRDYLRPVSPSGSLQAKSASTSPSSKRKPLDSSERPKLKPLTSSIRAKSKPLPSSTVQPKSTSPSSTPVAKGASTSPDARPDVIEAVDIPSKRQIGQRLQPAKPCWLTVSASGRHILLPETGELVLGRFDPGFGVPPDIDLSYEDQGANSVSRQHAKIVGVNGYHTIEDLGSRQGVFVDGKQIRPGPPRQLQPGGHIDIGKTQLVYDLVPTYMLAISPADQVRHRIVVTPTGRRLVIAPPRDVVIGRADPNVNFVPDIDLGQDGNVATRVSRRHAMISWRNQAPYLEDLGSGFGTRVNGNVLLMGQTVQLKPGDHIWLGGCVLAYDVDL